MNLQRVLQSVLENTFFFSFKSHTQSRPQFDYVEFYYGFFFANRRPSHGD